MGRAVDSAPVHDIAGIWSEVKFLAVPGRDVDLVLRDDGTVLTRGGGDGEILSGVGLAIVVDVPAPGDVHGDTGIDGGHLPHNTSGYGAILREDAVNRCLESVHRGGSSPVTGGSSGGAEVAFTGQGNRTALSISATVGGQSLLRSAVPQLVSGVGQCVLADLVHVRHAIAVGIHALDGVNCRVAVDVYVDSSGGRCIADDIDLVSSDARCPPSK